MNLQELKSKGGVVAVPRVKKRVEWTHTDPETGKPVTDKFEIWVKRHTFDVMVEMFAPGDAGESKNARYLAASVMLGKDGTEALPIEDAKNLDPDLGFALLGAVNSVNQPAAKKSPRKTSSGTSSS